MKKSEFIRFVADESGLTQKDVNKAIDGIEEVVYNALSTGDTVPLITGLKLERALLKPRNYRNPQSGEVVVKPARYKPKAKFSAKLKEAVNESLV